MAACASATAHPIDFGQIRHWTGSGPNRAALVVQFNGDTFGSDAYVYGYRWENGQTPNGEDMFKAICANSARLSLLTQRTGLMGSTVCGIGYGLNQDALRNVSFNFDKAKTWEFINFNYFEANTFMGQKSAPGDQTPTMAQEAINQAISSGSNVIQHPFDQPTYGYPAYDYDCWPLSATTSPRQGSGVNKTKWFSAWYEGYWSYWLANTPDDDWLYSGSGFTGRQLRNGSVDAWSFTQFEQAMVGGMGEGVVPCEGDGQIHYIPPRLSSKKIDASKAVRTVGSGELSIPVVITWGSNTSVDNVVYDLHFNGAIPAIDQIVAAIAASDNAFEANIEGNEVKAIGLDANADGDINPTTYSGDAFGQGQWQAITYEDAVHITRTPQTPPAYYFYLPTTTATGAWVPEEIDFALADSDCNLPVFVQPKAIHDALNYTFYRRSDSSTSTHSSTSTAIITGISTASASPGKLTFKGSTIGEVYIHARVRIGTGSDYTYTNACRFTVKEPEIPLEAIEFANANMDVPLNQYVDNSIRFTPENATFKALSYKSSATDIATASTAGIKTTTAAGAATITIASLWNPSVTASFNLTSSLKKPVTNIHIRGIEGDTIMLHPKRMIGLIGEYEPADADIKDFTFTIEGSPTERNQMYVSAYRVNYWDEQNVVNKFYELSAHHTGQCRLIIKSADGAGFSKEYVVKVTQQDRTPLDAGYIDGTIILNEEWFGHTNGGMNYITPDYEMIYQAYERENPNMSFGCTSQYGTIWANKLIVASKQAADGGDPLPGGGRLVVADARTLKRLGSIDDLMIEGETRSGDGRAVVGVTPSKVYVGTSGGIYIVDIDQVKVIGKVGTGDENAADLYNGQIGDMVSAGRYVYAIKQNTGTYIIDKTNDQIVKLIADKAIQGITQSADGRVWLSSIVDGQTRFTCINPDTNEEDTDASVTIPRSAGNVTCSWGAWRSTHFTGCKSQNVLWFAPGSGITGGNDGRFYCWEIGSDPTNIKPFFNLNNPKLQASNARVSQMNYGTLRYDDRSKQLIVMTCDNGASGHYRYVWTHFVDPSTGQISRSIELEPYYWFQSLPIFPDKYDAVLNINEIKTTTGASPTIIDLSQHLDDPDNIAYNINATLVDDNNSLAVAQVTLEGKTLTVIPKAEGEQYITLQLESNGRVSTKTIPIKVAKDTTGISAATSPTQSITCNGARITLTGFNGTGFSVYNLTGALCAQFDVDTDHYVIIPSSLANGIYLLQGNNGASAKIILNR